MDLISRGNGKHLFACAALLYQRMTSGGKAAARGRVFARGKDIVTSEGHLEANVNTVFRVTIKMLKQHGRRPSSQETF